MKLSMVLQLIIIYLDVKFHVSAVSATRIFNTKNAEIILFLVIASKIFGVLTSDLVQYCNSYPFSFL